LIMIFEPVYRSQSWGNGFLAQKQKENDSQSLTSEENRKILSTVIASI